MNAPDTVQGGDEHWTEEEWAVFCGNPDECEDLVRTFDNRCDAEELAHRVINAHIGRRVIRVSATPWVVHPCCSSCGSVIDGESCCESRRDELAKRDDENVMSREGDR